MLSTDPTELELKEVSKHFGGVKAIDDVSIGFEPGKITCVIGPNGAGKTTLFNLISGALIPDAGEISYKEKSIHGLSVHRVARLGIGRLFQDVRVFPRMTLIENVAVACKDSPGERFWHGPIWPIVGRLEEKSNLANAAEHLAFVGLAGMSEETGERISYGQQKLVAIARLLNNKAHCLLLDEPTAGVNPSMVEQILSVISRLAQSGKTVVVIEHDLGIVGEIGDWVYLMDRGRVEAFGTAAEMLREASLYRLMPRR